MSPRPIVLVVANSRKAGWGWITRFWSSSVSLPGDFEHALDHEHHVRPAGVVFVEGERHRMLQAPRQQAFAELGDLLAVLQHDRVLADQIDAADVAVEIDADAGPVEARGHLLDMGRLAGAVIALDHDAAVEGEARQDRQRRLAVEAIGGVILRHIFVVALGEGRHAACRRRCRRSSRTSTVVSGAAAGSRPCGSVVITTRPDSNFAGGRRLGPTASRAHEGAGLGQAGRPQDAVGLDHLLETLLSAPIAAIGVRVEPLH